MKGENRFAGHPWSFSPLKQLWALEDWYDTTLSDGSGYTTTCTFESRYFSDLPDGSRRSYQAARIEAPCTFTLRSPANSDPAFCFSSVASRATQVFSTQGEVFVDVTNSSAPVKHYPDGIVEVFSSTGGIAAEGAPSDASSAETLAQSWNLAQRIDRNGKVTTFANTASGWTVTEPRGQTTTYSTSGTQSTITKTGPMGVGLDAELGDPRLRPDERLPRRSPVIAADGNVDLKFRMDEGHDVVIPSTTSSVEGQGHWWRFTPGHAAPDLALKVRRTRTP
jgi:hypothetical protein